MSRVVFVFVGYYLNMYKISKSLMKAIITSSRGKEVFTQCLFVCLSVCW